MLSNEHFVEYDKYCDICKHSDKDANEDPCWDCLAHPVNTDSRRPIFFDKKPGAKIPENNS